MRILKFILYFLILIFFSFIIFDYLFPLDTAKLKRAQSIQIYDNSENIIKMALSEDEFWRYDLEKNEIPELLKQSVLLFEDRYFYYHFGVNPISILRAFFYNLKGEKTIGASTITMQVARMMQRHKRTYLNKIKEILRAFQLEWHYSKDEILSFYLNLAPYGGNIEGIKAASYFYFNKNPKNLSIAQIALLTTIPKNPNTNRLDRQKNLNQKRKFILNLMLKNKLINKSAFLRAGLEPISQTRHKSINEATHFTNLAIKNKTNKTSLDLNLQKTSQIFLTKALNKIKHLDVKNASLIIINNKTMQVISYIGSENLNSEFGENDGILAIRSPGSTLKPFIYAKALELGLITPKREIFDIPLHIGYYEPENFTKSFLGIINAKEALQYSLNIPAVELNSLLGQDSLYEILQKTNISSVDKPKEYYQDALALGGFGISLLDLTHIYTAFANSGKVLPLNLAGEIIDKNVSIISPQSAWLVSEILSDGIRAELNAYWQSTIDIPKIGFKTGTSADSKDLYAIGFSRDFTIGIWMGNFSGEKTQDLTGLETSAKVVFEIFRYLNNKKRLKWLKMPENIEEKLICVDGILIDECKSLQYDYIIKDVEIKRPCSLLRAEVLAFLIHIDKIKSIYDLDKNICFDKWSKSKPVFISPYHNAIYKINKNLKDKTKIMLQCYSFTKEQKVFFKINDGDFFEAKSKDKIFINLKEGVHKISCLDDFSRAVTNEVRIIYE